MDRPRILIITAGQLSRNPRVLKEAAALSRAGYGVTVIRVANAPLFNRYDDELLRSAPFECVTVNHLNGTVGDRVRAFADRAMTKLARRAIHRGFELEYALGPIASLLRAARRVPSDLTIVHTEAPFAVGRILHSQGRRIAADFEDWHSQDLLPTARAHRPLRLLTGLERDMMRLSEYGSTTSECLSVALRDAYGGLQPVVVRNTFDPVTAPPSHRDSCPRLFWFSQHIGPGRGLEAFVDAWSATVSSSELHLLGECDPYFRETLVSRCPADKRSRLRFSPVVAPAELPGAIAANDIGLALELSTPPSRDLTITNKILQYLASGLGVLATATKGQREVQRLAPNAVMLLPHDRQGVTRALEEICAHPDRIRTLRAAAVRAAATDFSWESDAARLVTAVGSVLPLPTRAKLSTDIGYATKPNLKSE